MKGMVNWYLRLPLAFIFFFLVVMVVSNIPYFYQEPIVMFFLILIAFAFLIATLFPLQKEWFR